MAEDSPIGQVANTVMSRRIELEEKGYTAALAEAAVKRALKKAASTISCLPKDLQERALAAFVDEELKYVERWMDGVVDSFQPPGAPESEVSPE